jgi:hypothetical protein
MSSFSPASSPARARGRRAFTRAGVLGVTSLLLLAGPAGPAAAQYPQQRLSIAPTIGLYLPTTTLVTAATGGQAYKQEVGLAVGGRLTLHLGPRLGIEATGTYVPSQLKTTLSGGATTRDKANLWFGSGRATFYLVPPSSAVSLGLSGGVGVVGRGGKAYSGADAGTEVGGTVGAIAGFRLGVLNFSVSADDYIYNPGTYATATGGNARTQHDLQFAFGFGVPVGR